ncbi:MAG: NUDIX domain-containing protein [Patescibacteria group bacterium]|nr:NUDIX domain-containing protein [Patescibacteria group bacterium]
MPHINEKLDFTVTVFIVHDNKVLLRMHDKYNVWLGVGGHIEPGEDPIEALYREVKEECGLEFELAGKRPRNFSAESTDLPVPAFINRHHTGSGHEHVDMLYVARAKTLNIQPGPGEKQVEFRWFAREELENSELTINDHTRYYAAEAIKLALVKD